MKLRLISVAVLSTLLAACGGGGTASDPAMPAADPLPPVVVAPVAAASSLVTSVATPSYVAGSEELAAFNYLNAQRSSCGFGLLAQNTTLDQAAKGHADWQLVNHIAGHYQSTGTPGFTGITPEDRAVAANYASFIDLGRVYDEGHTVNGATVKTGFGVPAVRGLLNAPYHLKGLMASGRDVGFTVRNDVDAGSTVAHGPRVILWADMGSTKSVGTQLMDSAAVATYPCEGSTGIDRLLDQETPNPVPGRDLAANPLGSSIYIAARDGQTLVIASATMTNASTGAAVTLRAPVGYLNDPYPGAFLPHEAYVAPDAPLAPLTRYQVNISGTNNGTAFTRSFIFTTGN